MNPLVSISCITYNHAPYIRQCLDGFMMQQTNFAFEVLIHDDASTDGTTEIIREFEAKYPQIIKPIYQEKNQYSQGIPINATYIAPKARGKYTAFCEGDDYWCDSLKLQKQVDVLENHPNCNLCLHTVRCINESGKKQKRTIPRFLPNTGLWDSRTFLEGFIKKYFFQISSYLIRTDVLKNFYFDPPLFVQKANKAQIGDDSRLLYLGQLGSVYYIKEEMSHYRVNAIGSWSIGQRSNTEKQFRHHTLMLEMLDEFNIYTNFLYDDLCQYKKEYWHFRIALIKKDKKELKKKKYKA